MNITWKCKRNLFDANDRQANPNFQIKSQKSRSAKKLMYKADATNMPTHAL